MTCERQQANAFGMNSLLFPFFICGVNFVYLTKDNRKYKKAKLGSGKKDY